VTEFDLEMNLEASFRLREDTDATRGGGLWSDLPYGAQKMNDNRNASPKPLTATGSPEEAHTGARSLGPLEYTLTRSYHALTKTVNSYFCTEQAKTQSSGTAEGARKSFGVEELRRLCTMPQVGSVEWK
jgi:hypothetical protein